jgi:hypothetical protein
MRFASLFVLAALLGAPSLADDPNALPEPLPAKPPVPGQEFYTYRFGATYGVRDASSATQCQMVCKDDLQCESWSWIQQLGTVPARCELKRGPGSVEPNVSATSGTRMPGWNAATASTSTISPAVLGASTLRGSADYNSVTASNLTTAGDTGANPQILLDPENPGTLQQTARKATGAPPRLILESDSYIPPVRPAPVGEAPRIILEDEAVPAGITPEPVNVPPAPLAPIASPAPVAAAAPVSAPAPLAMPAPAPVYNPPPPAPASTPAGTIISSTPVPLGSTPAIRYTSPPPSPAIVQTRPVPLGSSPHVSYVPLPLPQPAAVTEAPKTQPVAAAAQPEPIKTIAPPAPVKRPEPGYSLPPAAPKAATVPTRAPQAAPTPAANEIAVKDPAGYYPEKKTDDAGKSADYYPEDKRLLPIDIPPAPDKK